MTSYNYDNLTTMSVPNFGLDAFLQTPAHQYSTSQTTDQMLEKLRMDVMAAAASINNSSVEAEKYLLSVVKTPQPLPGDVLMTLASLPRSGLQSLLLERADCSSQVKVKVAMAQLEISARKNSVMVYAGFNQPELPLWLLRLAVDVQVELARRGKDPWLANVLRERPELPLEARAALTFDPAGWEADYFGWVYEDGNIIQDRVAGLRALYPELDGLPMAMLVGVTGTLLPADKNWQAAEPPASHTVWAEQMLCLAKGETDI